MLATFPVSEVVESDQPIAKLPIGLAHCPRPQQQTVPSTLDGVVTLNQVERKLPIIANTEAWDFNDLACRSIAKLGRFRLM